MSTEHSTERVSLLALTDEQVARLTLPQREARVTYLLADAARILDEAIDEYFTEHLIAGTVILFSGGNDSTVLAHIFRDVATHAAHANTGEGVGIKQTRDFVRNVCEEWGLPLIERSSPNQDKDSYRAMVLERGFPGPAQHWKMYQRLKERALRAIRSVLVKNPRRERVIYIAGRRRQESDRRNNVPASERVGSIVWVSPLIHWTKLDLMTYRTMQAKNGTPVPVNEIANLIHMSGECLCGSFAHAGEREEITMWVPDAFDVVAELETLIADREDIPVERRKWGWGAYRNVKASKTGPLCVSCEDRFLPGLESVA